MIHVCRERVRKKKNPFVILVHFLQRWLQKKTLPDLSSPTKGDHLFLIARKETIVRLAFSAYKSAMVSKSLFVTASNNDNDGCTIVGAPCCCCCCCCCCCRAAIFTKISVRRGICILWVRCRDEALSDDSAKNSQRETRAWLSGTWSKLMTLVVIYKIRKTIFSTRRTSSVEIFHS